MANLEQKLTQFHKIVLSTAEEKKKKIIDDAKRQADEMIQKNENEALESAYNLIQSEILKINREKNKAILSEQVKSKKELLLLREKMIGEIFYDVSQKIAEFTKTQEYLDYLFDLIGKGMAIFNQKTGLVISINQSDVKRIEELKQKFSGNEVLIADEDIIGGVVMRNKDMGTIIDYSIKQALENEKENFLAMSGLSIY